MKNRFQLLTKSECVNDTCNNFKNAYIETSGEAIGTIATKTKDWVSEDTKEEINEHYIK